jgi:RNA polymerase sigma factor (sigma-70 family)
VSASANWSDVDPHQHVSHGLDTADLVASAEDPARFGDVFERNFETVRRYAARRLGMRHADDVAAETFARAFSSRASFQPARGSSVRAWLFGFAVNIVREHERVSSRQDRAYGRFTAGGDDGDDQWEGVVDQLVDHARIEAALRELSPEARDLLLLVAGIGLSYKEAAIALCVPVGTVKSRVSRARVQVADGINKPAAVSRDREKRGSK